MKVLIIFVYSSDPNSVVTVLHLKEGDDPDYIFLKFIREYDKSWCKDMSDEVLLNSYIYTRSVHEVVFS